MSSDLATSYQLQASTEPGEGADVFDKCREYTFASEIREHGVYQFFREITSGQDPVVCIDGRDMIMFGSNNYLGLASHPEVKQAAIAAVEKYGTGVAGSRLLNGTLDLHVELEERLARFMNREAALVFSTGYQVNLGVLSCLLGRQDVAILDSLDHACIIDGVRLGFSKIVKFAHNDMDDLAARLSRIKPELGRMIVVDGVYSMEGDLCPLDRLVEIKKEHGVRLMVDDAHGIGVFGRNGRGVAEHFGVENEVDLIMGTFSKSLASVGGFITGDASVISYIKHNARSGIFSAACTPATAASVIKAIEICEREPERRGMLWQNTRYMKRELDGLGFDTGDSESPVIPVVVGEDYTCFRMVTRLHEEGIFVNPVITPAVQPGRAMLRTSFMATHTREQLDRGLEAIEKVGREFGVI